MRRQESQEEGGAKMGGAQRDRQASSSETGPSLPVFLFPSELVFYSEQRDSHRRVLTLYNPYTFTLTFKMLCTAPSLYRVVEAEGSVRAKSCVDLVVRHLDVSPRHWGRRDQFRLDVRGGGRRGGRGVWAELKQSEGLDRRSKAGSSRQQRELSPLLQPTLTHLQLPTGTAVRSVSQWVVCVLVASLCVAVLMLPLHTDSSSMVPRCLHVSTNQKLVSAYTLGLLTMVFLR